MKRPSFQFYPDDWTGNSNLRRCTHEEKGIWMDVLCVLHDQDEYGVARWPLKELAEAAGCTIAKLQRLVSKGVLKGADVGQECEPFVYVPRSGRKNGAPVTLVDAQPGPLWYSSRMVTDEHKRQVRGGIEDTQKPAPNHSPKGGIGEGIGAAPKGTPDHSPSHARASRAAPSSPSPSSVNPSEEPSGSSAAEAAPRPPDQMTKDELWAAGKSLLSQAGMPAAQCGSFVGKLVKDHGPDVVVDAVRSAVLERPADPASFLKAACQRRAGQRQTPNRQEALEARNREVARRLAAGGAAP